MGKNKRLDKKGETPSRLELTQAEQSFLRRAQTAYPDRSLEEAASLFEKERDYKMSSALKKYVKTKKGDSKKYGVGMMSGGMANCGASMKATQKSTNMAYGGMARKK